MNLHENPQYSYEIFRNEIRDKKIIDTNNE